MTRRLKILLPILLLVVAALAAWALIVARPRAETRTPEVLPPLVRVMEVRSSDLRFTVRSQGTVRPRTESALVPEVSGRVVSVSPSLAAGGFIEKGEVLLRLDPADYEQAVVGSRARVERARVVLAREEAEAEVAREEWRDLYGDEEASPLTSRALQVSEARAALLAAEAELQRAELDLERTRLRAPYAGRVREKLVDIGQFVTRGQVVVRLYAVDRAEIRLPLPDAELAYLDLPLGYRGETAGRARPEVILRADFAGRVHEWTGYIDRTEGEIDPKSRMVNAVAVVDDPYGKGSEIDRPPLASGMFVEAEILGREAEGVFLLPRSALREADRVVVVTADDRLRLREVEVLRATRDEVVVGGGLSDGERVCLSPLSAITDGMRVRTDVGDAS